MSEGVSIFVRPVFVCVCVSGPVAVSPDPHSPQEEARCHFSQRQAASHAGWPRGLQTNGVWSESLPRLALSALPAGAQAVDDAL